MLRDKDIKNISELKQVFMNNHKKPIFPQLVVDVLKLGKRHSIVLKVKSQSFLVLPKIRMKSSIVHSNSKNKFLLLHQSLR